MSKIHQRVQQTSAFGIRPSKGASHCHYLVAQTAMGIAESVYDKLAGMSNEWYKANPSRQAYAKKSFGLYIDQARRSLTDLLTKISIPQEQKDVIEEALVLDNTLRRGRSPGAKIQVRTEGL